MTHIKQKEVGILICEDEDSGLAYADFCREIGFSPVGLAANSQEAQKLWATGKYRALWMDLKIDGDPYKGFDFIANARFGEQSPERIFIYSAIIDDGMKRMFAAFHGDTICAFRKSREMSKMEAALKAYYEMLSSRSSTPMIAASTEMRSILNRLPQIEVSDLPVLIVGNSGDGKSHLAELIADNMISKKYASSKKLINCAAIPESLFESELFGHMKGAFTGSSNHKIGLLMAASGFGKNSLESASKNKDEWNSSSVHESPSKLPGVIILDELAALPRYCQAKLLSVLDGKPIQPLGYVGPGFEPNFRVVATTNEIEAIGEDNRFRQDLRMRLEGWLIVMPPLAKQTELVKRLTQMKAPSYYDGNGGRRTVNVDWTDEAIDTLVQSVSSLAGGVRQLQNVIARAAMFAHFSQAREVTSAFVSKALSQKMPSVTKDKLGGLDEEQVIRDLIEQWLVDKAINLDDCRSSSGQLSYQLIAKATSVDQGKELVDWCIERKADIAGSERDEAFLLAVGAGNGARAKTREGVYKLWRTAKRS